MKRITLAILILSTLLCLASCSRSPTAPCPVLWGRGPADSTGCH